MAGKRKGGGEGSGEGGGRNRGAKRWKSFAQKGQLSGPGILLTTLRRKERKAGLQLIEFLNDIADEVYPGLQLSSPTTKNGNGQATEYSGVDEDDDDAQRNGPVKATAEVNDVLEAEASTSAHVPAAKNAVTDEDDIEAQIRAELQALKPRGKGKSNLKGTHREEDTKAPKARFELIELDVECLIFVTVAEPMDPVRLCCSLLEQVAKTGQVRGMFIQRLSPVYQTSRADLQNLSQLAEDVMSKHPPDQAEPFTFKVEPRVRLHNVLNKMDIIQTVAAAVPAPHRADVHHPQYIVNIEVFKSTIGIGILPRYEEYKRYNPQMIAQKYSEDHAAESEQTSRTLQHSAPQIEAAAKGEDKITTSA